MRNNDATNSTRAFADEIEGGQIPETLSGALARVAGLCSAALAAAIVLACFAHV